MNDCVQPQALPSHAAADSSTAANGHLDNRSLAEFLDAVLYERLRKLASGIVKREAREHGWEGADLLHEAFLRMARSRIPIHLKSMDHVIALSAIVMRHVLVDRIRSTTISDRYRRVALDPDLQSDAGSSSEQIAIRDALARLGKLESRLYQVVEMRLFFDLAIEEIAANLSISSRTVKRDWKAALDWLRRELNKTPFPLSEEVATCDAPKASA
jgi:RNA polymerase sigma-70 factor, ECF subfamily